MGAVVEEMDLTINFIYYIMREVKNRIELARYFVELGFKVGAEIGVEKGYYSDLLCSTILGLKLYCIDSWKTYKRNARHDAYEVATELLSKSSSINSLLFGKKPTSEKESRTLSCK